MSNSGPYAFVSLLTSDHYLPGALALAAALKDVHNSLNGIDLVCLVTPETVDVKSIKLLRRAFTHVIGVEVIEQQSSRGLELLGRPDLAQVLTKLHVFRLTSYSKVVFLDADVLPLQPLDRLFSLPHEFAAAPDVGWPDIFNSGVMALQPGQDKFDQLMNIVQSKGSWDGGDQGVLNEWRGDDWHRLSFTYNTTPTAAYTYAPAYTRFGADIKAVHFIGANKPWLSLPYRAPYSQSSLQQVPEKLEAYAYGDLVDRWFAVYDKHYRPQEPPKPEFQVQKYESAWNAAQPASPSAKPLGLEELKRLAMEGSTVGSPTITPVIANNTNEGEYRSLPLDGRVHLIRPKVPSPPPSEFPSQEVRNDFAEDDELTPRAIPVQEAPSAVPSVETGPYQQSQLPTASPPPPPPSPPPPASELDYFSQIPHQPTVQSQQPFQEPHESPPRPPSPPMINWNPSTEPPPSNPPPPSAFKPDEHFENVWDQTWRSRGAYEDPHSFFVAPQPTKIPERLIQEGHYSNIISPPFSPDSASTHTLADTESSVFLSPPTSLLSPIAIDPNRPDKKKVTSVFPWEAKQRIIPGRVFPHSASPPPSFSQVLSKEPQDYSPTQPAEPVLSSATPVNVPSSLSPPDGSPTGGTFSNAWDAIPSIQRYASRLQGSRSPLISQSQPSLSRGRRRSSAATYKSWEEPADDSSNEGDDEDEGDESGDEQTSPKSKTGRRSVSRHSIFKDERTGKTYRSQSTQTERVSRREMGVQSPPLQSSQSLQPLQPQFKGQLPPSAPDTHIDFHAQKGGVLNMPTCEEPEEPGSLMQSAEGSALADHVSPVETYQAMLAPNTGAPPPREFEVINPTSLLSSLDSASPQEEVQMPASQEIIISKETSPNELFPTPVSLGPTTSSRQIRRRWDPARGVEVFKQQSEEVLERFLSMGSWERTKNEP